MPHICVIEYVFMSRGGKCRRWCPTSRS